MPLPDHSNSFYAKSRKAWRNWLEKNGGKQQFIWLIIYHKRAATPGVYYDEAVEEALCFGWIDSRPNKRDDESFYLFFAERKPKSNWSKINKQRVEKLITEGKMAPAGLVMVQLAKKTGTWTALEKIDRMELPTDLEKLFNKNKMALNNFNSFPPSAKKGILEWIMMQKG